jgi:ubiquinone/menaquinone biosynthesis C-methylase UbiE
LGSGAHVASRSGLEGTSFDQYDRPIRSIHGIRFGLSPTRLRKWLLKQPVFTSTILPAIPRPLRWTLRKAYFFPLDVVDRIRGRRQDMVPPKAEIFTGAVEGFCASGETLEQRLIDLGGLTRDSKVLDVGCGIGRLAVPLTRFLDETGSYEGLDIVPSGIAWCNDNIASKFKNFRFTLADVFNKEYNPGGHLRASEYTFPYDDETFDLIVLISVFTHMLPTDMENYVSEISRVLNRHGRCFATYFLINEESSRLMHSGASSLIFNHHPGPHWLVTQKTPELSVGYDEPYVRDLFESSGLSTNEGIHYGGWCGREPLWSAGSGLGDQDIVLAMKR